MAIYRPNKDRHGVLLLIILALLAMFGATAIAFVMLTRSQKGSAHVLHHDARDTENSEKLLTEAAAQVLRGSNNIYSVIGPHSLLDDVYGSASVQGSLQHNPPTTSVQAVAGGQLISFTPIGVNTPGRLVGRVLTMGNGIAAGKSTRILGYDPGNNLIQIAAFEGVPTGEFIADAATQLPFLINGQAFAGTGFGFNPNAAPPFMNTYADSNGLPFALRPNPAAPTWDFSDHTAAPQFQFRDYLTGSLGNVAASVAANEEYDAVDYQNMLLAMVRRNGIAGQVPIPSLHRPELVQYWFNIMKTGPATLGLDSWTASEIEQAILDPWSVTDGDELRERVTEIKRKIILRPLVDDHPNFTGGNPNFNPIWDGVSAGHQWDVDNDGDGVADSIWVDLGMPVRARPDGQLYKPLFAVLCVDLDGRLNLNAHGSLAQANNPYYNDVNLATVVAVEEDGTNSYYYAPQPASNTDFYFAHGSQALGLRRGQGYGPAEINLRPILQSLAEYQTLLTGNANALGRYGNSAVPGADGSKNQLDYLFQNRFFDYWNEANRGFLGLPSSAHDWRFGYWKYLYSTTPVLNAFGSPADLPGAGAVALDFAGRPIYCRMGEDRKLKENDGPPFVGLDQSVDNPYEINLATRNANDTKFSPVELERILRPFDHDSASLPNRLLELLPSIDSTTNKPNLVLHRHEITSESWDIPAPSMLLTPALRQRFNSIYFGLSVSLRNELKAHLLPTTAVGTIGGVDQTATPSVTDLLIVRLARNLAAAGFNDSEICTHIARLLPRLVPLELLAGRKMDLNRPFGNGIDNNGNNVVDEPGRIQRVDNTNTTFEIDSSYPGEIANEFLPQINGDGSWLTNIPFNHCNSIDVNGAGDGINVDRALVRQFYARQLYIMALLLMDYQPSSPLSNENKRQTRLIAQWAVNIVDFRDRDSIMTPFEYDMNPFTDDSTTPDGNTWDVDGVIDDDPSHPYSDDNEAYRGLVWGCERPELLITETLAMHDRRMQNLDVDGGKWSPIPADNKDDHNDFDQRLRPEGSLFIELFNPSTDLEPKTGEFYNSINGGVDLTKRVGQSPVWRMAIHLDASENPDDPGTPPERSVYFVHADTIDVTGDGHRHYPESVPNYPIMPGRYAVIGPGRDPSEPAPRTTYIGFKTGMEKGDTSTRRITLAPASNASPNAAVPANYPVAVLGNQRDSGTNDLPNGQVEEVPNQIQPPVAVVVDRAIVSNAPRYLRLSVTEPFSGYPEVDPNGVEYDKTNARYNDPYLRPLDKTHNSANWDSVRKNGMHPRFRVVHLQRLANPCLPWNAYSNPYRTVDSTIIDLVTFNGAEDDSAYTSANGAPSDDEVVDTAVGQDRFCTRERGEYNGAATDHNLWTQEWLTGDSIDKTVEVPTIHSGLSISVTNHVFNDPLYHTLGYLNWHLTTPSADGPRDATLGARYKGDPRGTPFPWLNWNNRPFVSQFELLQVPAVSARALLMNPKDIQEDLENCPYAKTFGISTASEDVCETFNWPFPHLMNLFLSREAGTPLLDDDVDGDGTDDPIDPYASLNQLLDLVYVPSRFVGTELQGNPAQLATGSHVCHPPFHQIPSYREPGRINLNTIFSEAVFGGLLNPTSLTPPYAYQANFIRSLRGYYGNTDLVSMDGRFPTRIENPFRSVLGTYLVPQLADQLPATNAREIASTLLRPAPPSGGDLEPLFLKTSSNSYDHTDRNAYFRYQELQRLGNLTTTRSNVYAVWITVGYFEVERRPKRTRADEDEWTLDQYRSVYPDGYALGQELGSDTGEIERHRAFYIIDRSIPVGFQRGQDLNSGNCVLLKRFIE